MILVIGGTGNVGRHVVAGLVARGERPRVLTRDRKRARSLLGDDADIVGGDLADAASVDAALAGIDRAFLATSGSEDQVRLEGAFIDSAGRAGVKCLVKLSGGLADYPEENKFGRWHAEIEAHLKSAPLAWTALRPNWFATNFLGEAQAIAQGTLYGAAADGRLAFVDVRDIADVAVLALTGDGHAGKTYRITGPEALTFAEAAQAIGTGLGRSVNYVDLPEPAYRDALEGAGLPEPIIDLLTGGYRAARKGLFDGAEPAVGELTGHAPRSLETFARDHAEAFPRPAAA